MPKPNCTGEQMALHTILNFAQDVYDFKEDELRTYLTLPEFANDQNFFAARDELFKDWDVLDLFDDENYGESSEKSGLDSPLGSLLGDDNDLGTVVAHREGGSDSGCGGEEFRTC